jgi:hypothetical protein
MHNRHTKFSGNRPNNFEVRRTHRRVFITLLFPLNKHNGWPTIIVTQQSVTCLTNRCNFDNSLSVLQATADVTAVDRPLQFVAKTKSDGFFFGDVYRSAQDDILTDVIGRGWSNFFVCSHDMVVVVEFVLPFHLTVQVFI